MARRFDDKIIMRLTKEQRKQLSLLAGGPSKVAPYLRGIITVLVAKELGGNSEQEAQART
jgi:hypothetical protein